jgi:hypothetical protein
VLFRNVSELLPNCTALQPLFMRSPSEVQETCAVTVRSRLSLRRCPSPDVPNGTPGNDRLRPGRPIRQYTTQTGCWLLQPYRGGFLQGKRGRSMKQTHSLPSSVEVRMRTTVCSSAVCGASKHKERFACIQLRLACTLYRSWFIL